MQCRSSQQNFIRYTVDEEIEFRVDCYTGSGHLTSEDFGDANGVPVTSDHQESVTETVTESSQSQSCERNTSRSLVVRNGAVWYEWKLRKAERIAEYITQQG